MRGRAVFGAMMAFGLLAGCGDRPGIAPRDAALIATFRANRGEFEYWRGVFDRPQQNCRVERVFGHAVVASLPCDVGDTARLSAFMDKAGISLIEARRETREPGLGNGPVEFVVFAEGFTIGGQTKQIAYDPVSAIPLAPNLDVYNWGLLPKSQPVPTGIWRRRIEGAWYLCYGAG